MAAKAKGKEAQQDEGNKGCKESQEHAKNEEAASLENDGDRKKNRRPATGPKIWFSEEVDAGTLEMALKEMHI